ncbi:MAG: hypothetical protein KF758_13410 [Anaerolineales bacterium]|nr:hypothetical protein [Anaerolineales bacterium]MBX3037901.1 hypothetical protein [Anaerolineales bacterium]
MKKSDWREFIFYGLGGFLLFIVSGYATIVDLFSFHDGDNPLFVYISKSSGYNDLGVFFTIGLGILSIIGLGSFIFYLRLVYRKLQKK